MKINFPLAIFASYAMIARTSGNKKEPFPDIVIIHADDLGYGDVSSYRATREGTETQRIFALKSLCDLFLRDSL